MRLEPYDEQGLMEIARQRARIGLIDGSYSEGILRLIGQAASEISDARVAIEPRDVQSVSSLQPTNLEGIEVDDLPPHCMMVLLGICRRLKNDNEIATGDIESIYKVVCEEFSVEGKGHTTLWKYLKRLEDRDILASRLSTVNQGRGRTQFF